MSPSIRSASRVHAAARTQSRGGPILLLIWLATVLFLVIAHSAEAQAPDADADANAEYRFGQLELIYTQGEVPLPPVRTDVELQITGPLIRTIVRQEFSNPTDEVVSARYLYPLPERAAVAAMELQVGERRIVSVVKEKEAARKVYEQARKEGRKAALVSESRRNLFTTKVANIAPGETVHVQLEYLDQVGYEDGWFEFVHPLTFTPRYFPPAGETDPVDAQVRDAAFVRPGDAAFPTARIEVELSPGLELAEIRCPSHEIHKQQTNLQWEIRPDAVEIPADRDFILRWRPTRDPLARPLLFVERTDEASYALLMVVPGDPDPGVPRPAADTVFVLDISGSMGGPSIEQAKSALIAALGQLRAGDRFTVMAFDDRRYVWSEELESVSSGSRESVRSIYSVMGRPELAFRIVPGTEDSGRTAEIVWCRLRPSRSPGVGQHAELRRIAYASTRWTDARRRACCGWNGRPLMNHAGKTFRGTCSSRTSTRSRSKSLVRTEHGRTGGIAPNNRPCPAACACASRLPTSARTPSRSPKPSRRLRDRMAPAGRSLDPPRPLPYRRTSRSIPASQGQGASWNPQRSERTSLKRREKWRCPSTSGSSSAKGTPRHDWETTACSSKPAA